jgi:nicotinamide-nucleotide amidase
MARPSVTLAESVLGKLRARGLTLVTAESCTAGGLATLLADATGGGECFHGGFVVYTKENKAKALGVPAELIAAHTAVSQPVAEAMATGALERCPADIALSITGVAGPDPDEDDNPVGLMHVAVACRGGSIRHSRYKFDESRRDELRERAIQAVLELAESMLDDAGNDGTLT